MTIEISAHAALSRTMQDGDMLPPDKVVAMLRLHELGWGTKRLSKEFGCARNTVRRYLREGGAAPFKQQSGALRSTDLMIGFASGFSGMTAMRI